jgi:uncharacterized SAM-binding protein YcdF (DUF218 family)
LEILNRDSIGECFFPADKLFSADLAIVLGMNDWRRPCCRAIELYNSGVVKALLFAGGFNRQIAKVEALEMAQLARNSGIPEEDILIEARSVHTDQNFAFAKEEVACHFGPHAVRSMILVTIHYHLRRSLIAARKYFPGDVRIGWACYPSRHYTAADWHLTSRGRADVAAEVKKIEKYYSISVDDLLQGRS